jgi:hypothetical protein
MEGNANRGARIIEKRREASAAASIQDDLEVAAKGSVMKTPMPASTNRDRRFMRSPLWK